MACKNLLLQLSNFKGSGGLCLSPSLASISYYLASFWVLAPLLPAQLLFKPLRPHASCTGLMRSSEELCASLVSSLPAWNPPTVVRGQLRLSHQLPLKIICTATVGFIILFSIRLFFSSFFFSKNFFFPKKFWFFFQKKFSLWEQI